MSRGCDFGRPGRHFEHLDRIAVPAPPAGDLDHVLVQYLDIFDRQVPADGEVMKGAGLALRYDVEPRQVPAGSASISGLGHRIKLIDPIRVSETPHSYHHLCGPRLRTSRSVCLTRASAQGDLRRRGRG